MVVSMGPKKVFALMFCAVSIFMGLPATTLARSWTIPAGCSLGIVRQTAASGERLPPFVS
jgi:hypothetical protein